MHFVRDRITLQVVTCGVDERRGRAIAAGSERLEVVPDNAAATCYANVPSVRYQGFQQMHPYEYAGRKMLDDERDRLIGEFLERNR